MKYWKDRARRLKAGAGILYLAARDPRTPWYARALAVMVVGYLVSPIDLIPDPIPVLGYLDDLVIVSLGVALVVRMIPREVWRECEDRVQAGMAVSTPNGRVAAAVIIMLWLIALAWIARTVYRWV